MEKWVKGGDPEVVLAGSDCIIVGSGITGLTTLPLLLRRMLRLGMH